MYTDADFTGGWAAPIVKAYRKRIGLIYDALDERDIRNVKGNHLEKLKGREPEHSVKLNDQWRLILTFEEIDNVKTVVIRGIEDYH